MAQIAYAEVVAAPQTSSAPKASPFMSMVPLLFIFGVFYFLLIRPQQKKSKEHKNLLESLKPGDMVITGSGIYAAIVSVGDKTVELKIAENVKIKAQKSAIAEVLTRSEALPSLPLS